MIRLIRSPQPAVIAAALVAFLAGPLAAQDFTGVFTAPNDRGGVITLTLQQNGDGSLGGRLEGNGSVFQIAGRLQNGAAVGTVRNDQVGLYFQAQLDGGTLIFTLVEAGADGQPDPSTAQPLQFTRQEDDADATGEADRPAPDEEDPFAGTFSNGTLTVTLERSGEGYRGIAQLQGQQYPMRARVTEGGHGLAGSYLADGVPYTWSATGGGNALSMVIDGQPVVLQRQARRGPLTGGIGGAASGLGKASGARTLSPLAQQWDRWLRGKRLTQMSSYSSGGVSGSGGYSDKKQLDLCSDGSFYYAGSSLVNADVGGAFGYNGGNQRDTGRWRIIEQGGLVGIELRFSSSGQTLQARLDHQGTKVFVDGTRTFVTPDNASCR